MLELLREIKKHLLIYRLFLKNSLMAQITYDHELPVSMSIEVFLV